MTTSRLQSVAGLIAFALAGCTSGLSDGQANLRSTDSLVPPTVDGIMDGRSPHRPSGPPATVLAQATLRFDHLDRDLTLLESRVFRQDLTDELSESMASLHRLRNRAALAVATSKREDAPPSEAARDELSLTLDLLDEQLSLVQRVLDSEQQIH